MTSQPDDRGPSDRAPRTHGQIGCVALLSGGLDSMLAIRVMQEQGIRVEAVNFQTLFTCCQETSGQAARLLQTRVTVLPAEDD
ncbi:MAG: hypothetical protein KDA60_18410, partial [Planctomycetales bacterium]|nr:hypothetical protein [Planctomycetales bacterium]